ncbi:AAA-like domain-containing protein [Nostoc sp. FACHB-152]|uniref:AAA-like domain-containing protein n=1 Tax=unclassified Nostoc TaxID=2593658 RepID=UPI0016884C10|nr:MULTISPECIES: AAA-like domain-containing protein [unclassified Nostoc]MBD2450737.1 AAA-like domain-containing protein [Nostoc sp. FACHB-152]MBD2471949.1 AAA-like domain-containing protein [Nostoc sp. FACHB-145]
MKISKKFHLEMKEEKNKSLRKRGVVLTVVGLKRLQTAILEEERQTRGGKRFTQVELSDRIGISTSSLSRLWSLNSRIDPRTMRICFSAFDLALHENDYTLYDANDIDSQHEDYQEEQQVIDRDLSEYSDNADSLSESKLSLQQKTMTAKTAPSEIVSVFLGGEKIKSEISLHKQSDYNCQVKITEYIKYPCGPLSLDSKFYIPRPPLEELAYQEIMQPGCVIRIKGYRGMGKTSLMLRILAHARMLGYETAKLNMTQVDINVLQKPQLFMQWLAASIARQLGLEFNVNKHWDEEIGSKLSCTLYLKEYLLAPLDKPLLLVFDEVQHIFEYPDLANEFLPLLRSWQEEAQQDEVWTKLRLVIVYSTDVYLSLDINQSPFNIGLPLKLSEFTLEQVIELANHYGIDWQHNEQVQQLMELIGGHPALLNITLYHLHCQKLTLEEILRTAVTELGIYRQHLRTLLNKLQKNAQLLDSIKILLTKDENIDLDILTTYQLENMGLIQLQQQKWVISCKLYRDFLKKYIMS